MENIPSLDSKPRHSRLLRFLVAASIAMPGSLLALGCSPESKDTETHKETPALESSQLLELIAPDQVEKVENGGVVIHLGEGNYYLLSQEAQAKLKDLKLESLDNEAEIFLVKAKVAELGHKVEEKDLPTRSKLQEEMRQKYLELKAAGKWNEDKL